MSNEGRRGEEEKGARGVGKERRREKRSREGER